MNKLTKLLSVFVIAGALGAGIAGAVGCNNGGGDDEGGHRHNYTWVDDGNGKCHEHCDVDGCDLPDKTAQGHVWGNDNICDNCEAVYVAVESIAIEGNDLMVAIGDKITLTATLTPANATESVIWSIKSGADKAEIDPATGELTGIKKGLVTVLATAGGKTAEKSVQVKAVALSELSLVKRAVNLKPAETYTLEPVYTPANASNKKITWTSSAPTVATVNEDGKITAVADGEATVTGVSEDGNKTVTCAVEVDSTLIDVKYEVSITEAFEQANTKEDRVSGFVTIKGGTNVRGRNPKSVAENKEGGATIKTLGETEYTKSVQFDANAAVVLDIPAAGTLILHTQNTSSGVKEWQYMVLSKPNGKNESIGIAAFDGSPVREIVVELDAPGTYTLSRGGNSSSDLFYLAYECRVKDTPLESIEFVGAKTDFYVGQQFSTDELVLNKIYSQTHRTEAMAGDAEGVDVDYSQVNMTTAGTYTVNVTYTVNETPFQTSYDVTVYAVDTLTIGKNATVKESTNSSAGNGVYANHHLRELYFAGDTLSTDGLTVTLSTSTGTDENKKVKEFIINSGYTLTIDGQPVTTLTAGKHSVTVTLDGTDISEEFVVYVIDGIADLSAATSVAVKVDAGTADNNVGVISDGAYQFQTIHQALEFLENCKAPASASKVMRLAAGTYTEKLEIRVPNLTIIGAGTDQSGAYSMIEWDSLYGVNDESGYSQVTDSTATLNVRDSATGFTIRNVIISNWFNSADRFVERFGKSNAVNNVDHRALAMLIQADKVRVENCSLLGYQDTLEVFTGRHVFENCLIIGVTDFIFGTNGTTYFTGCELRAIKHVKDVIEEKGQVGYYTAMKGCNKGADDVVKYGLIFDDCDFTAEDGVTNGWAIGRTWGAYAAVMIMNSSLSGNISKTEATRYLNMNGAPKDAQFTEYNNTGAGAISASQTGVTVPEATEAAKYNDFTVIFGKTNGKVTYPDVWDGQTSAKNIE